MAIAKLLEAQEQQFSHYRSDSEVSRFNQHDSKDWFPVSAELAELAQLANEISQLSEGAFDITVAPAVNIWGFGPDAEGADGSIPEAAILARTGRSIGYQNLLIRRSPPALGKTQTALAIDMSAIAKGHAVDQLAYALEQDGHTDYLIEIGGELRTSGSRPDGKAWRIGLEAADKALPIEFVVAPGNNAVATSGDYRNFFVRAETRYSHAIDPATARPIRHGLAAVSVVAPSAAQADGLATALLVLGMERGMQLAIKHDIAALFTARGADGLSTRATPALSAYLLDSR